MRNIVVSDEYHQSDLKPSELLKQYVQMLSSDVFRFLVDGQKLTETSCPACASASSQKMFERYRLTYRQCQACGTLYISPRPADERINHFYANASCCRFWREQLSEAARLKRSEKIIKPRLEWVLDSTAEYCPCAKHWADIHTGQLRYAQAMEQAPAFSQKTLVNPYFNFKTAGPSTAVVPQPWWAAKLSEPADVVTLFEVIDQASGPGDLLTAVRGMLGGGGLCFMTCILSSGFDVKELGQHAQNIYPPDRLNVFSVKGIKTLIERHGFECLEFSTPGILDVEIVARALRDNPQIPVSVFVRDLVLNQGEDLKRAFQEFLQANLLSSYGRILIRKI